MIVPGLLSAFPLFRPGTATRNLLNEMDALSRHSTNGEGNDSRTL
jgi:hypothetical protein